MDTWKIYKHTNKVNGKCYIGQTCRKNPNERWNNGKGYIGTIFGKAIEKYGWENFSHEIIEDGLTSEEEANKREIYWISHYNSFAGVSNSNGYNMTRGGDDRADKGRPVYQIDIETLKIIKEFPSALNAQRETKAKCVYACCSREKIYSQFIVTGDSYWCFVDEWSKDWKPKKGRINYVDKNGKKICDGGDKQVCQIDKNGNLIKIYKTATAAAKEVGVVSGSISKCCRKQRITAAGFYWCFKKDLENFEIPQEKPLSFFGARKIICVETNVIYESITKASKSTNIPMSCILAVLSGKYKRAGGYHWEYSN